MEKKKEKERREKEKERREKECKESEQKELKTENDKKQYYPSSPQYTHNFPFGSDSYVFVPLLTDKLVPSPEGLTEQNAKEDKDSEMNYDSDNTVNILRSELI